MEKYYGGDRGRKEDKEMRHTFGIKERVNREGSEKKKSFQTTIYPDIFLLHTFRSSKIVIDSSLKCSIHTLLFNLT